MIISHKKKFIFFLQTEKQEQVVLKKFCTNIRKEKNMILLLKISFQKNTSLLNLLKHVYLMRSGIHILSLFLFETHVISLFPNGNITKASNIMSIYIVKYYTQDLVS